MNDCWKKRNVLQALRFFLPNSISCKKEELG